MPASRHQVDTSTRFDLKDYNESPATRRIEVPDVREPEPDFHTRDVDREPYIPDGDLIESVNLAIALGRPLLLQGEPGCGKTRLAYALAYAFRLPLEVAHIKSTSRAQDLLYTYDAVKRLYDAELGARGPKDASGHPSYEDPRNYVRLGPLGRAIARAALAKPRRSVVLLDEIDKADIDFPNDLLWELEELDFEVTDVPGMRYTAGDDPAFRPIVVVTHNVEKALPSAFLRRCVYHYIEFPRTVEELKAILKHHRVTDDKLSERASTLLLELRNDKLGLAKKPGLSELIDWVSYAQATGKGAAYLEGSVTSGVLLKEQEDRKRAQKVPVREGGASEPTEK